MLTSNCNREIISYILPKELWLNKLYFEISNRNKKICLTIDCRNSNSIGSGKYRTKAKDPKTQFATLIRKKDKLFNTFLAKRIPNRKSEGGHTLIEKKFKRIDFRGS